MLVCFEGGGAGAGAGVGPSLLLSSLRLDAEQAVDATAAITMSQRMGIG